jgi:hypothetical protein
MGDRDRHARPDDDDREELVMPRCASGAPAAAIVMTCLLVMTRQADASPATPSPILVLEAYGGRRPSTVDRFMNPLRDQLERHGFAARPETISKLFGSRIPRPGILDPEVTTAHILELVHTGYEAFSRAQFDEAASKLTDAIAKIKRNSALLVLDTGHQDAVYKAHVGLALSQARLGSTDQAAATMGELVRMLRTQPISRNEHGPTAEQLARTVYEQASSRRRGRLRIDTGNRRAMLFIDYQLRGMGTAALDDLIPGVYHVLVHEPGSTGLAYEVEVPEGGDALLDASWEIDRSLIVSPRWIGFELAGETERRKEAAHGGSLARRWSGRASFAVVGTMKVRGRPALVGTRYLTTGEVLRRAVIVLEDALDDADDATLGALAKFLADGTPAAGIEIVVGDDHAAPASPGRRRRALPAKLLLVGGAAAVIAGGVLYAYDEDDHPVGRQEPTYFDSAGPGLALGAAGVVAIGVGSWLWARGGHRPAVPFVSVRRSIGMVGLAHRF